MKPVSDFLNPFRKRMLLAGVAAALQLAGVAASAASYYVVVPIPNRTAGAENIALTLNSYALPQAIVGQPYAAFDFNKLLTVTGDATYSGYGIQWSVVGGALPAGMNLDANGKLAGAPTAAGTSSFQVMASYKTKAGAQAYQVVTLDITVTLASATLPAAKVGTAYPGFDLKPQVTVAGDDDYDISKVSFTATNLPDGLSLTDGVLNGTPTTKSTSDGASFQVVASYRGVTGQQTYKLLVNGQYLDVKAIAPGWTFTCALTTSGGVKCWGQNTYGQLGNGSTTDSLTPVDVVGLAAGVTSLGAGANHACASTAAGAMVCWGYNVEGELGDGTATNRSAPVAALTSGVARVAVGGHHSCALTTIGGAKCWGDNNSGQVGDKSNTPSSTPVDVPGLTTGLAGLSAGAYHTCAVTSAGTAVCWGTDTHGEIGDGLIGSTVTTKSSGPKTVQGLPSTISSISAGSYTTCAITTDGGLYCWGYNAFGQLGNGATTDSVSPVAVTGLSAGVASVAAGSGFTCALLNAGGVDCWGQNNDGQLGNGTGDRSTPAPVLGLTVTPASLSIGNSAVHACIVAQSNAQCWGFNNVGQLGNNTTTNSVSPVTVLSP